MPGQFNQYALPERSEAVRAPGQIESRMIAELGTLLARAEEIINQLGVVSPDIMQRFTRAKDVYNQIRPEYTGRESEFPSGNPERIAPEQFERIARGMPRSR